MGCVTYLSCLLFQHQQLVDRTLNIGLPGSQHPHPYNAQAVSFSDLCKQLRLGNQLVSILAEVLLGLEDSVGHGDESCYVTVWRSEEWAMKTEKSVVYLSARIDVTCVMSSSWR